VLYDARSSYSESLSLYQLLDISPNSSIEEIKAAYRRQALKWHPDRNLGSAEAAKHFNELNQAYTILIDREKRSEYDSLHGSMHCEEESRSHVEAQEQSGGKEGYVNEMIKLALEIKASNVTWNDVVRRLVLQGCPQGLALQIAITLEETYKESAKLQASELGRKAAIAFVIGIMISVFTAQVLKERFLVVYGFYLYGCFTGCRALYLQAVGSAPSRIRNNVG